MKRLKDTFRVSASNNSAVQMLAPVVNGNAEALHELQERVLALEKLVDEMNMRSLRPAPMTYEGSASESA